MEQLVLLLLIVPLHRVETKKPQGYINPAVFHFSKHSSWRLIGLRIGNDREVARW